MPTTFKTLIHKQETTFFAAGFSSDDINTAISADTYLLNGSGVPTPDLTTLPWVWGPRPDVVITTPAQGAVYAPTDLVVPAVTLVDPLSDFELDYTINGSTIDPTKPLPLSTLRTGTSTLTVAAFNLVTGGVVTVSASFVVRASTVCTPGAAGCNDNVMFLPGIESSELFASGSLFENKIWLPNSIFGQDITSLDLTNPVAANNVYTKRKRR